MERYLTLEFRIIAFQLHTLVMLKRLVQFVFAGEFALQFSVANAYLGAYLLSKQALIMWEVFWVLAAWKIGTLTRLSQLSKDANLEKKISKPLRLKPDEKANELMKNAAMITIHFLNR